MRRHLLILVLALGTVAGFASGFAHHHGWRHVGHARCGHEHGPRPEPSPPPASP